MPWPSGVLAMPSIKGTGRAVILRPDLMGILMSQRSCWARTFTPPLCLGAQLRQKWDCDGVLRKWCQERQPLWAELIWNEESVSYNLCLFALSFLLSLDSSHKIQVPVLLEAIVVGTHLRRPPGPGMDTGFKARPVFYSQFHYSSS